MNDRYEFIETKEENGVRVAEIHQDLELL